jgi:glycine/D-amino acid oxidase-like deaminating enzyme
MDDARPAPLWHDDPQWKKVGECVSPDLPNEPLDILIIGAGLSGLWTAIWLDRLVPHCRIAIVDADGIGAGASSRNGGWCSAVLPMTLEAAADRLGDIAAHQLYAEAIANVADIGTFVADRGIDCSWRNGGTLVNATHGGHLDGVRDEYASWVQRGFTDRVRWLEPDALRGVINVAPTLGGYLQDFCASLHPARLVAGLAREVVQRGVTIHAPLRVEHIDTGVVTTSRGSIRTRHTVRATEAFTPSLRQYRRDVMPVYSLMVATEPLQDDILRSLAWADGTTFTDGGELVVYAQLTTDGRLAFGGRGARTPFASRPVPTSSLSTTVHERLVTTMHQFFPATTDSRITHRWGGAVAAHRDWWPAIRVDTAISNEDHCHVSMGGYVGDGVATSHLLARHAARLLAAHATRTRRAAPHPLTDGSAKRWEPEPLRFIGSNAMIALVALIDRREKRRERSSQLLRRILAAILRT